MELFASAADFAVQKSVSSRRLRFSRLWRLRDSSRAATSGAGTVTLAFAQSASDAIAGATEFPGRAVKLGEDFTEPSGR